MALSRGILVCISLLVTLEETLACSSKDVNRIATILLEVEDWSGLATELDIETGTQNKIKKNCKSSGDDVADCYRRKLVQTYCDSTGLKGEQVAENIAQALESIGHKKQANQIRGLYSASGKPAPEPEKPSVNEKEPTTSSPTNGEEILQHTLFLLDDNQLYVLVAFGLVMAGGVAIVITVIVAKSVPTTPAVSDRRAKQPHKDPTPPIPVPPHQRESDAEDSDPDPSIIKRVQRKIKHPTPPTVDSDPASSIRKRPKPPSNVLNDPVFKERVKTPLVLFIEYYAENDEIKTLRIIEAIAPHWEHLASLLRFRDDEIATIKLKNQRQPLESTRDMLVKWIGKDVNCTWKKLITNMKKIELEIAADELTTALMNQVEDED